MYMIEIETKEMEKASEYAEKALKYMGKVMQCISSWEDEAYGERGGMNYREHEHDEYSRSMMGHGGRKHGMNYRDDDDEWDDEMNERRGRRRRDSMGRYR
jgi:hypothetical protein